MRPSQLILFQGLNYYGELGINSSGSTPTQYYRVPMRVSGNNTYNTVATGLYHTCAIAADYRLYCWVSGWVGPRFSGRTMQPSRQSPVRRQLVLPWDLAYGPPTHTPPRHSQGYSNYGQVGTGVATTTPIPIPTLVDGSGWWKSVATGDQHTCAIRTDGSMW